MLHNGTIYGSQQECYVGWWIIKVWVSNYIMVYIAPHVTSHIPNPRIKNMMGYSAGDFCPRNKAMKSFCKPPWGLHLIFSTSRPHVLSYVVHLIHYTVEWTQQPFLGISIVSCACQTRHMYNVHSWIHTSPKEKWTIVDQSAESWTLLTLSIYPYFNVFDSLLTNFQQQHNKSRSFNNSFSVVFPCLFICPDK